MKIPERHTHKCKECGRMFDCFSLECIDGLQKCEACYQEEFWWAPIAPNDGQEL